MLVPSDQAHRVLRLLDTSLSPEAGCSCFGAALREARVLVGRDPATGTEPPDNDNAATWAGALLYLIYLEQVGSCFSPAAASVPSDPGIAEAALWFGGYDGEVPKVLKQLRHRFAHDYTLEPAELGKPRFVLSPDEGEPLFRRSRGRPWIGLRALADLAETTQRQVREMAVTGQLAVHHIGGLDRVEDRFAMRIGPPSEIPAHRQSTNTQERRPDRKTGPT